MSTPAGAVRTSGSVAARVDAVEAVTFVALLIAVVMWTVALGKVNLSAIDDLGLVSALPALLLASLALLTISFAFIVTLRPNASWLMMLHVLALIFMLFAVTAIVEPAPRFSVAWRHVGIIENLTRTGRIDPSIDAYFSWPGFFTLGAFFTQALGLQSALDLTPWAPVVFNLLYLPAVILIMRAGTTDTRVVWVATWLFFIGNWIGQDYFSPQGFDYFLYLLVIGILLTWFRTAPTGEGRIARWFQPVDEPTPPPLTAFQRAALMAIVVLLFGTTVYSHQLTPFALLGVTIVLVLTRRMSATGLPVLMAVMLGSWLSYMTVEYLRGHIASLVSRIGNVDTTVAANITQRVRGSDLHLVVIVVRILNTLAIFGLAGIGALHRLLTNRRDLTWLVLAAAPFGLMLLQDYGGEILLRVYLFSLPFAVFLGAHALVQWGRLGQRLSRALPVGLVALVLVAAFLVSRYGNERMDLATADEAAGMQQLYRIAPTDSVFVAVAGNIFWKFTDYELYHYRIVTPAATAFDMPVILAIMRDDPTRHAFIILSRAQRALLGLQFGFTDADWQRLEQMVETEPALTLVYRNPDLQIFELKGGGAS